MTTIAQTLKLAGLFCALALFGANSALAQDLILDNGTAGFTRL